MSGDRQPAVLGGDVLASDVASQQLARLTVRPASVLVHLHGHRTCNHRRIEADQSLAALPCDKASNDTDRYEHRSGVVEWPGPGRLRFVRRWPLGGGPSRDRLYGQVNARLAAPRSQRTVSGYRRVDEAIINSVGRSSIDAQVGQGTRPPVRDDCIAPREQSRNNPAGLIVTSEIEPETPLATIHDGKSQGEAAERITCEGLDLNDVCTKIGQYPGY